MNNDIIRQRRNVIALSIALSVYEIGGGDITEAPTFLGAIKMDNPGVIIIFTWSALVYFVWRYWLYTGHVRGILRASGSGKMIVPDQKTFIGEMQVTLSECSRFKSLANSVVKKKYGISIEDPCPILVRGLFTRKIDFSTTFKRKSLNGIHHELQEKETEFHVSFFKIVPIESRAQLISMFRYSTFSDYSLPYFIASTPIIIVALKFYMQYFI